MDQTQEFNNKKSDLSQLRSQAKKLNIVVSDEKPTTLQRANELIEEIRLKLDAPPPTMTAAEAKMGLDKAAADEMAEMKARLARMEALLAAGPPAPASFGGMTEEQFTRLMQRINQGQTTDDGFVREDWVDPNDRLEQPVTFFTPFERDWLSFRPEGGVNVPPPNSKKLFSFKNKFRWIQRTLAGDRIRSIATLVVMSKKEAEWIKKHPKYGRTIFEDSSVAITATQEGSYARLYKRHETVLAAISDHLLPQMAAEAGIPVSTRFTPDDYRTQLAELRTKDEMSRTERNAEKEAQERQGDRMLLAGMGVAPFNG